MFCPVVSPEQLAAVSWCKRTVIFSLAEHLRGKAVEVWVAGEEFIAKCTFFFQFVLENGAKMVEKPFETRAVTKT